MQLFIAAPAIFSISRSWECTLQHRDAEKIRRTYIFLRSRVMIAILALSALSGLVKRYSHQLIFCFWPLHHDNHLPCLRALHFSTWCFFMWSLMLQSVVITRLLPCFAHCLADFISWVERETGTRTKGIPAFDLSIMIITYLVCALSIFPLGVFLNCNEYYMFWF